MTLNGKYPDQSHELLNTKNVDDPPQVIGKKSSLFAEQLLNSRSTLMNTQNSFVMDYHEKR